MLMDMVSSLRWESFSRELADVVIWKGTLWKTRKASPPAINIVSSVFLDQSVVLAWFHFTLRSEFYLLYNCKMNVVLLKVGIAFPCYAVYVELDYIEIILSLICGWSWGWGFFLGGGRWVWVV